MICCIYFFLFYIYVSLILKEDPSRILTPGEFDTFTWTSSSYQSAQQVIENWLLVSCQFSFISPKKLDRRRHERRLSHSLVLLRIKSAFWHVVWDESLLQNNLSISFYSGNNRIPRGQITTQNGQETNFVCVFFSFQICFKSGWKSPSFCKRKVP